MFKRIVLIACLLLGQTAFAEGVWQSLGDYVSKEESGNQVELTATHGKVRIMATAPGVVRVTYGPGGALLPDHSFAVIANAFPATTGWRVSDSGSALELRTDLLVVRADKSPMRITFLDANDNVLSEERPDHLTAFNGTEFRVWKAMPEDEHYFGLGDKSGPLDHRDLAFTNWNTDMFGWQESTDPLYKTIPFFLALRRGSAYGVFLDNTYRSNFDFGKEAHDLYSFGSEGGALDYYFFYGPTPKRVIEEFTQLVGRTPLPPLFALGYQQCRYTYYPESQVLDIAAQFRKRKIPADVLYLDIDYQQDNRPFTVNRERFPTMEKMIKDLDAEGFKLVTITDLHIAHLPGYRPYDEGEKNGYFLKNPDGSIYVGKVWPGDSVFPDFTRQEVRKWWGSLYTDFVKMGIRGFWNDMNEPSVFDVASKTAPLDTKHSDEGRITDHREIHNVFGMENARATYEGMLRLTPDVRPFVLTRAAYAGTQRYAATWTGDNTASWNHLRLSIPQMANLGLSGYSFVGADIGGFNGSPTPELLTRWMELGAFNPIYRNHSNKGTRFREPWVDGPEHERIRKRYIETRYRLLPYIYTAMEESSRTGIPLMRPMFLEFPEEGALETNGEEFMFGSGLLVAPKVWPFLDPYFVTLPQGDWYDFWTGTRVMGEKKFAVDPPLDTLPVYVRAGTILPQQPLIQHVGETPQGPLELRVYPGPQCAGDLYMDDGNTLAYQRGEMLRMHFTCSMEANSLRIDVAAAEGRYQPWFKDLQVSVFGISGKPSSVEVDGKPTSSWNQKAGPVSISGIPWSASAHTVRVNLAGK
ncbi:MAG TPA: glycoside hydrolase family 31 protein [Terriglobales bacterium]|jgi:alpha-glucosidase|nr:glycoside hydrolase family 31 protein [Terriglobales bacterium]